MSKAEHKAIWPMLSQDERNAIRRFSARIGPGPIDAQKEAAREAARQAFGK